MGRFGVFPGVLAKRMTESKTPSRMSVEGTALLSLPFDHYQRYALTQRLVGLLWPGPERPRLRILDVGGHSSSLKHFLPGDEVVLVDTQAPPPFTHREGLAVWHDGYILAIGQRLPFSDGVFDLATAHDTLEHVPDEHRAAFLRELLRVARRFVILNGPVYHLRSAQAERRLADFMQRALQGENVSLREHLNLGLPRRDQIEGVLQEQGLIFISIPNGNLSLWLAMMALKHYVIAFPNSDGLHEVIDRTYNAILSPQDFAGHCYREAYVIAKNQHDLTALRAVEAAFPHLRAEPPIGGNVETLEPMLRALEEHASDIRGRFAEVLASIAQKDSALVQKEALLVEKEALLAQRDAALAERDALLIQHEQALLALRQELEAIRLSTGYRLLESYRRAVRWLFPMDSLWGLPYRMLLKGLRAILNWKASIGGDTSQE